MKITNMYITGYKNLIDCNLQPSGIHAITGCNSSGKSNLIEVVAFVSKLISASDELRSRIFEEGRSPTNTPWFPKVRSEKENIDLNFELDSIVSVNNVEWEVQYCLEVEKAILDESFYPDLSNGIKSEKIYIKKVGQPGRKRLHVNRKLDGTTKVVYEKAVRKELNFKTRRDMSALQALEVREADDFFNNFPIIANFRRSLIWSSTMRLDPYALTKYPLRGKKASARGRIGPIVQRFDLYALLKYIKEDEDVWENFSFWMKKLADIDRVSPTEFKLDDGSETGKEEIRRFVLIAQQGRFLVPDELSMGSAMILGILSSLFTLPLWGAPILIEEPESYLHPKAISDLIILLRDFSEDNTLIFSTHSPVALNSLRPEEVTLMKPVSTGFYTTKKVKDIKEAVAALNRGFMSFGDLLQTDFETN